MVWPAQGSTVRVSRAPACSALASHGRVVRSGITRSRPAWITTTGTPANCAAGSSDGVHGVRPTTPATSGSPPTRNATRPPRECPTTTIGSPGSKSRILPNAQRASRSAASPRPFQPRIENLSRYTVAPGNSRAMALATGHRRRTAGSRQRAATNESALPPCSTSTAATADRPDLAGEWTSSAPSDDLITPVILRRSGPGWVARLTRLVADGQTSSVSGRSRDGHRGGHGASDRRSG